MNKQERAFLKLLGSAICSTPIPPDTLDSDPSFWRELTKLGQQHLMLPLLYDRIGQTPEFKALPETMQMSIRKLSIDMTMLQYHKTQKLLEVLNALEQAGIDYLLVKGLVCRSLYPNPDLRFSADEDLVVKPSDRERLLALLEKMGMRVEPYEATDQVIKAAIPAGLVMEVHMLPLLKVKNYAFDTINQLLNVAFERSITIQMENAAVRTMEPSDHLVFMLAHCMEHFVHSGVGIRQFCDIGLFVGANDCRLDYERIKRCLSEAGMMKFGGAAAAIISEWLCPQRLPSRFLTLFQGIETDTAPLLDDILQAGVFGKSTNARLHSANLTLNAVSDGRHFLRSALFPPASYMKKNYPYASKCPFLLPIAWGQRGLTYLKECRRQKNAKSDCSALTVGSDRIRLLSQYGLIKKAEQREKSGRNDNKAP